MQTPEDKHHVPIVEANQVFLFLDAGMRVK